MPTKTMKEKARGFARMAAACVLAAALALPAAAGGTAFAADSIGGTQLGLRITDSSKGQGSGEGGQPGSTQLGIRVTDSDNPAPLTVTVTFDSNGGSAVSAQTIDYNTAVPKPTDPAWAGHTFAGWYTSKDGGSAYDFNAAVLGNLTLYAHWTVNTYAVTFNSNGGTGEMPAQTFTHGTSQALSQNKFTRDGYDFLGWATSSTATEVVYTDKQSITVDKAIALFAVWKIKSYTVSFDSNGGTAVDPQKVDHNGKATQPSAPTRSGYKFEGWFADASLTTAYDFDAAVTSDKALYAKWTVIYTVAFDSNGGEGAGMASMDMVVGTKKALAKNSFTRTGYTFKEWNTKSDGTGDAYADGAEVDFASATAGGTVTLYAQWTLQVSCTIPKAATVTIDASGEAKGEDLTFSSTSAAPLKVSAVMSSKLPGAESVFADKTTVDGVCVTLKPKGSAQEPVKVPLATTEVGQPADFIIPTRSALDVSMGLSLPVNAKLSFLESATAVAELSYVIGEAPIS